MDVGKVLKSVKKVVKGDPFLDIEPEAYSFFVNVNDTDDKPHIQEYPLIESFTKDIESAESISVYLHFPLCTPKEDKLCRFCHYNRIKNTDDSALRNRIVDLLCKEISTFTSKFSAVKNKEISSFYIGGGTPSLMDEKNLQQIMTAFKDWKFKEGAVKTEKTIEATPGTLTESKINMLANFFNRISVGVQTMDESILNEMNRLDNDTNKIKKSLTSLLGNANITTNIDLIYGFPNQNTEKFLKDIESLLKIQGGPTSFTLYRLRLRRLGGDKSELMGEYEEDPKSFPNQFQAYEMKLKAKKYLEKNGYTEGPIGWFTKKSETAPVVYTDRWSNNIPLIGFGQAAYSYSDNVQFRNEHKFDLYQYYVGPRETLPITSAIKFDEALRNKRIISFRLKRMEDIEESLFDNIHQDELTEYFIDKKLLKKVSGKFKLTEIGEVLVEELISGYIWEEIKVFFSH
ncbi:MAG: radical SAM protein [Syntrophales bacterium]|nr:radical SAM protein [Syntrophales bacterium]